MKHVRKDLRYDGATVEQVFGMLGSKEFREAVCDYQRVLHRTVTVDGSGDARTITIDQGHADRPVAGLRPQDRRRPRRRWSSRSSWTDGSRGTSPSRCRASRVR